MVRPLGRCQLSVTTPTGSLIARTVATPSAIASMRALRQRQPVDEGRGGATGADLGDVLGIRGKNGGCVGADGALDRFQRAVLLLRAGERQRPRGGARAGGEIGHQSRQIGVCLDRLQRRAHVGSSLS